MVFTLPADTVITGKPDVSKKDFWPAWVSTSLSFVGPPGVGIIAPYPGGYYAVVSGTSFAAPLVAGEAALLRSLITKQNVKDPIKKGTIKIDQRNPGRKLGDGRIDLMLGLSKR